MSGSDIRFDGRSFVVTGAGRGLGRQQAITLSARGANVVVADNGSGLDGSDPDGSPAESVVAEIRKAGGEAVPCLADIATESGSSGAVQACLEAFQRVDGIIHNASTSPDLTPPDQISTHDLELVMRVNPLAGLWMTRKAWPHMAAQKFGRIVFMPSAAAYGALGNASYAAAKSAYFGLLRCIALEGRQHNICVNGIMPAARSRMTEELQPPAFAEWFSRTMLPEQVAMGAAYLLSDACKVNGEIFAMGGSRIARVTIAESEGILDACNSIESVRDAMPDVLAATDYFYPRDLSERSVKVNALLGFQGGIDSNDGYAVKRDVS